jgi:prepilin-type N-terminal cleavage/methylation domain-containing protein
MDNKGFTLVELLAVMVLLLAISVVTVTNVTASLKRNEESELKSQEKMAISAAKIYFSFKGGDYVDLQSLLNDGYIEDESSVEKLKEKFNDNYNNIFVVICNSGDKYEVKEDHDVNCD